MSLVPRSLFGRRADRNFTACGVASLCVLLGLSACGSSTQPGELSRVTGPYECPATFSACGGSLVGSWQWAEACIPFDAWCFELAVVNTEERKTTFSGDGVLSGSMGADTVTDTITAACYAASGPNSGKRCTGSASDVCAFDSAGNCVCSGGTDYPATEDHYTASGSTFTLNFSDATPSRTFDYCVQGSTLAIRSAAGHVLFYSAAVE